MRIAVVEQDRCQPKKCNYECVTYCPVVRQGVTECIQPGPNQGKAVISEELCIGCGICVNKCPFDAIHIINLPEQLDEDLIHRFGENAFTLFRLPVPREGAVVGLLGPNGIGKSTAIKMLSGGLTPNLGDYEADETTLAKVLERYAGTELGDYLKRVADGKVKAVTKPQYVDLIPKAVKGVVRDLLTNADERGVAIEYAERLGLAGVLDRDLKDLSGGELQRAAIIAALAKDADVYFIDEPSSYLDIDQRLRVGRLIREVADEGRSMMVIEHDLAILDFLADHAHLLYGKEAAYGVVAHPRGVRQAINTYLEGFMREENIRFRDTKIEFDLHPPRHQWMGATIVEFPALKRVQGDFTLESEAGEIKQGEVVGVVGPNATGKTTFVKMLAGVIEPTEGEVEASVKVAYKPQYIKSDVTETVETLLYTQIGGRVEESFFKNEVQRPLGIERLKTKKVNELSGGELQRVALGLVLGQEADLYLLDEPSAYLDVDQRMVAARTIRRVMENRGRSALVVDHDVYFIDVIADSLMVFGGEPGRHGTAVGPLDLRDGMNRFLANADITFRRDKETLRPRINKPGSRLDREQRNKGEYYYDVPKDGQPDDE